MARHAAAPRAGPVSGAAAVVAALAAGLAAAVAPGWAGAARAQELAAPVTIVDGGIAQVLPGAVSGDPARGRAIVASRQEGLCLLCHSAPIPEERFQGDLATDLAGVALRASAAQLRLRLVDPARLNPETIMAADFRIGGLVRVAEPYRGRPILDAQQIEDVLAWLLTLVEPPQPRGAGGPVQ